MQFGQTLPVSSNESVSFSDSQQHVELCHGCSGSTTSIVEKRCVENIGSDMKKSPDDSKRLKFSSLEDQFIFLCTSFSWLSESGAHLQQFKQVGKVHCSVCDSWMQGARTWNVAQHEKGEHHMNRALEIMNKIGDKTKASITIDNRDPRKIIEFARSTFTASAMRDIPKSAIQNVFSPSMIDLAYVLKCHGIKLGSAGTVDQDFRIAARDMHEAIGKKVKDVFGTIVVDGATTSLLGGAKLQAIIFSSTTLKHPVLLATPILENGTAAFLAETIKSVLVEYGIDISTNVVEIIGDNCNFNDALAAWLGLPRAKCIPHALNLVIQAFVSCFPKFGILVMKLGTLLHQGGTVARSAELRDYHGVNFKPNKLTGYGNRFASTLKVAKHLLSPEWHGVPWGVLEGVRSWLLDGETVKGTSRSDPQASEVLKELRQAYFDNDALLQLFVVYGMLEMLPELIKKTSAEPDNVPASVLTQLNNFHTHLELSGIRCSKMVVEKVMRKFPFEISSATRADLTAKMISMLQQGATAAIASFDTHVKQAINMLKYRVVLDPRNEPPPFQFPVSHELCLEDIQDFFGCLPEYADTILLGEWQVYRDQWSELRKTCDNMKMTTYWENLREYFPTLAKVGMWYAEFSTSSISAERAFAMMRGMEDNHRMSMQEEAFDAELSFTYNGWIVDELVECAHQSLLSLPFVGINSTSSELLRSFGNGCFV